MTTFSKIARIAVPLAFAALLGLAACSKEPNREQTDEPGNYADEPNAGEIPPEATPRPVETLNQSPPANVAVAAPIDHTTEDQQMQEDADASGMTSHLPPPDQGAPASETEKVK